MDAPDPLLKAILADPADDTLRLAYADHIQDLDEPVPCGLCRGRGSLRLGILPPKDKTCERCKGAGRLPGPAGGRAEFIRKSVASGLSFYPETTDEPPPFASPTPWPDSVQHWRGRRGFVESITCAWQDWLEIGPAVCKANPITLVTLNRFPTDWAVPPAPPAWGWDVRGDGEECEGPSDLPAAFWCEELTRDYATEADAQAVLSARAVNWARGEAGLDPLDLPMPDPLPEPG